MRVAATVVGLATGLLLSGCSGSGGAGQQASPTSVTAVAPSASGSAPTAGIGSAATASTGARGPATGSKSVQGKDASQLLVELRRLHRDGKLMRLDYSVTNISAARLFAPDVLPTLSPTDINAVDSQGLKKYLVVKDSAGQYAFTPPRLYLVPQSVFDGTAYFAAPPTSVTTVTVNFAELGLFATPVI